MARRLPRAADLGVPSEYHEMLQLAEYLDRCVGVKGWLHVPNEGKRSGQAGQMLKNAGMKKGAPDVLIFAVPQSGLLTALASHPEGILDYLHPGQSFNFPRGVAIELKKETVRRLAPEQREFGRAMMLNGWVWFVAAGARAAMDELGRHGYPKF